MARSENLSEQLDAAVESFMKHPDTMPRRLGPQLSALLRVAADLRNLPTEAFRARLRAELLSAASRANAAASAGPPLRTAEEIRARLQDLAAGPRLVPHDLGAALGDLPELSMRFLASLNGCTVGVSRFSEHSYWECHPAGDELLHILEGEAEITTLSDDGPKDTRVRAGSIFICPRGLWHRIKPLSRLSLLFATPGGGTQVSDAAMPRRRRQGDTAAARPPRRGRRPPQLEAIDLGAALRRVPELAITGETTGEEADAAFRQIAALDQCSIAVGRFSGESPWERHPRGDELLHVLEGEVEVTVLAAEAPVRVTVPAGSVFVCPRGLWHRQRARRRVTGLYATPRPSQVSWAEDPRAPA